MGVRHASTTASSRSYRSEAFVSPSQAPCARSFFSLPSSSFHEAAGLVLEAQARLQHARAQQYVLVW